MLGRLLRGPAGIDPLEADRRRRAGELLLVDVRERSEWKDGRAAGARHVPLGTLADALPALAASGQPVAFVCRSGARSASACRAAAKAGVEALNVEGGMGAWQRAGLRVERG